MMRNQAVIAINGFYEILRAFYVRTTELRVAPDFFLVTVETLEMVGQIFSEPLLE